MQALFEGYSATEAYALAGYKLHQGNSSRLRWYDTIQTRLRELQEAACKNSEITVESLMQELEDLRTKAVSRDQYAAGVAAVREKIRLSGLAIDKKQIEIIDNTPEPQSIEEVLADVVQRVGEQAAKELARVFGVEYDGPKVLALCVRQDLEMPATPVRYHSQRYQKEIEWRPPVNGRRRPIS